MALITLLFSEAAQSIGWMPLILGMGGIMVAVSSALSISTSQIAGVFTLMISIGLSAFSLIFAKKALARVNLFLSCAVQCGVGAIFCFILSVFFERSTVSHFYRYDILPVFLLAVFSSAIGVPVYYWLLKYFEPYQLATSQWVITLVAIAESAVLFRVRVPLAIWLGGLIAIACMVWTLASGKTKDRTVTLEITSITHGT
jgi:drug/metabolite transporter (DMT)-like permease